MFLPLNALSWCSIVVRLKMISLKSRSTSGRAKLFSGHVTLLSCVHIMKLGLLSINESATGSESHCETTILLFHNLRGDKC